MPAPLDKSLNDRSLGLTKAEIAAACPSIERPVLNVHEAAEFLGIAKRTLDEWVRKGRLKGTHRKRGRHVFFFRARLMEHLFNGPSWADQDSS